MPEYKPNEWEFQGLVVGWLNEFLSTGSYPFDTATANTSLKVPDSTKYPDVILWLNHQAKLGFCGWELKPPKIKADESELLKNAAEKAQTMQADYFVTWNMRDAIIWQTPKSNESVKAEHRLKQYPSLYTINTVEDIENVQNELALKNRAKEILDDLTTLKNKKTLHSAIAEPTFFVKKLHMAVENLYPDVEKELKKKVGLDKKFRDEIIAWARKQGNNATVDDSFYKMVARQMVYRLLARIIFYETVTGTYPQLPKLDLQGLSGQNAIDKLSEFFNAAGHIDWTAVFEPDLSDKVELSENSIDVIHKLIDDLNNYNFKLLPHDVIGAVFEQLIPETERHSLGQYFTRENLVDLINAFCIRTTNADVLDPTCGTGTFLLRAYDKKKTEGQYDHKELLSQLWGVDIANFPAELATINLFRQNIAEPTNFPRIICEDFFNVQPESTHKFPPLKKSPDPNFPQIPEKMPVFDAAVGNFPFIRQELIEKAVPHYKDKLVQAIKEDWLAEYPDAFNFPESDKKYILDAHKNGKDISKYNADFNLSGQADIYAYLFFHTARFIKEGGRMGFITSNSWLDVAYGYELQKFMLNNFKIVAILESRCEPWFEDAAVNTVVTILERCSNKAERDNHITKFVKIKRKLADLVPQDMKLEATERWYHLANLVDTIEKAGEEHIHLDKFPTVNDLSGRETREDDNFRVRIKKQGELLDELNQVGKTAKWGQYLRAPDVYDEILEKAGSKLTRLNKIADIRFGVKTGINEFFYLTEEQIKHWGIEDEFLIPVFKSPKESSSIAVDANTLTLKVFSCSWNKVDLQKAHKNGALKYISYGEKQKGDDGVLWNKRPSVANRNPGWWAIPDPELANIFWSKAYDSRLLHRFSTAPVLADCRLYFVSGKKKINIKLLAAILNSSISLLFLEMIGRVNLGEGALDVMVEDAEKYMIIPELNLFSDDLQVKILAFFDTLSKRPIKPIFEEVKMKDRQQLDSLILEALGLDPKVYLKPLYDGLTELVRERIELGKMRAKVKKAKIATDTEKIKNQVIEAVLPNGVKKFPEDFLEKPVKQSDCETVSMPNESLKLGGQFLTQHEIINDQGFKYMATSTETAKYIVYSQKPNLYLINVPRDDKVIGKAVQTYEIYLKELKDKLVTELTKMITDYKLADSITQQIFTEYGLPQI